MKKLILFSLLFVTIASAHFYSVFVRSIEHTDTGSSVITTTADQVIEIPVTVTNVNPGANIIYYTHSGTNWLRFTSPRGVKTKYAIPALPDGLKTVHEGDDEHSH